MCLYFDSCDSFAVVTVCIFCSLLQESYLFELQVKFPLGNVTKYDFEVTLLSFLQHSYGFIQCCERQARLFFHFSQFNGNIEHLKIGDPVEFEMTYDRRTGKPIASAVTKIAPEVVSDTFVLV